MSDLPTILSRGERSRLFPVLSENSKEGRTLSIILSCLENVEEFGTTLFSDLNIRIGTRTKIETYTEVVFHKGTTEKALRPDGLIVVKNGAKQWTALVEAKIGNSELNTEQIESYLEIAKSNNIDSLITISNQFSPLPTHHPVTVSAAAKKKAQLVHWSWMYILTQAQLLIDNNDISDRDQFIVLNEMVRFLTHESAGVKSFTQMPASWSDIVSSVQTGGTLSANSTESKEVVGAWHQETRDLSLILSRQLGRSVQIRVSRAHAKDPTARVKADTQYLSSEKCLQTIFDVPDAAAPIEICADLSKRCITVSMKLKAPGDRKTSKARLNWLLRQLQKTRNDKVHVRMIWPGRAPASQYLLTNLQTDASAACDDKPNMVLTSFEILLVKDCGTRFSQRRNFISDLEQVVPDFYEDVAQHLRVWQPPAPRLKDEKSEPKDVATPAIRAEAERIAMTRDT